MMILHRVSYFEDGLNAYDRVTLPVVSQLEGQTSEIYLSTIRSGSIEGRKGKKPRLAFLPVDTLYETSKVCQSGYCCLERTQKP